LDRFGIGVPVWVVDIPAWATLSNLQVHLGTIFRDIGSNVEEINFVALSNPGAEFSNDVTNFIICLELFYGE
jgi:hypothetical protein